jgi:integrase
VSVRTLRTPSYRHHKPSNQAVVTLNGRDCYLGRYDSPESRAEYDRLIAEWLTNGRMLPAVANGEGSDLSVNEVVLRFVQWAEVYYRKNGEPTSEVRMIRDAVGVVCRFYGETEARDFGPLALKTVRQAFMDAGLCRNQINKQVGRVVRCFRWAVENELVPPSVHHGLKAVPGLRRGRSEARESEPVKPVPQAFVDAIRPHVSRQVWAMIELQLLTGMRPGEVTIMRTCDLDMSGQVWRYTPESHKTEHHGRERTIFLGPQAQAVLKPWLRTELSAYLFSPREAMEECRAKRRENRKTPMTPSQKARTRKQKPSKQPGERYDTGSYGHAIKYGCKKAGIPAWHPHQLRHNAATRLRKEFGLDVARVILGHSSPVVTEIYAEVDREKAARAMQQVG